MAGHGNDNLATLLEPDAEEIVEELHTRFRQGILYVSFGDGIIALNPQTSENTHENSPENGKRYCSKRLIPNLPAHVYALAHNVYKDATSPMVRSEAHSILVSGIAGSGKTEISEMLIAQFLREAKVSRWKNIPFVLMKGFVALKRLLTCKSTSGPTSSTASTVTTLYFGQDGNIKTAKIALHLLNPRHAIPHTQDRGYLNIFSDLVAALWNTAPGLSAVENIHIILQTMDSALTLMNRETMVVHMDHWLNFIEIIKDLNIGENVPLGRQGYANSFLDSLLGLLLLATTPFDIDQNTKQCHLRSKDSFAAAAQLLGVSAHALFDTVMHGAPNSDDLPLVNAVQSRDQLVHELYSQLVTWLIEKINSKLPDVEKGDIPVHVADLQPFLDHTYGSLEDLCHNMAAEYIQMLQNKAVFARENDACKTEGMKVHAVKRQRCEDIVDFAFKTPGGLLHQLETSCNNLTLTEKALVKSLHTNLKKRKDLYVCSKAGSFAIEHSHKQVEYHVDAMFRHQNLIIPNREAQKLLAASRNVTVQDVFKQALKKISNPNIKSHYSYVAYIKDQINALRDQVFGAVPHFVRCIKPLLVGSEFDVNFLKNQVHSACLPDIIQCKKFGFSHWMTIPDFLQRYNMLDLSMLSHVTTPDIACKNVLKKGDILGKGPTVTKKYVFLGYWHKEKLDALVDAFVWKVTLVQAWFRGHLTRKRLFKVNPARITFSDAISSFRSNESSSRVSHALIPYNEAEENELFERMILKTVTRVNNLSSSSWAKVIYMEQGREVAEVYAAELSLLVTGSYDSFDGLELGLTYFHTPDRPEETEYIVGNLDQGIELRRDSDGSLLVRRSCQLPVCVKHRHSQPGLSADLLKTRGELPRGHFVKIFDMQEFYSHISLKMKKPDFSKASLQKSCITVIQFGSSHDQLLLMPCWIAVININALNVLNDSKELQSISLMASQLILTKDKEDNETKEEHEEAKMGRIRKLWSRSDQRQQLKMKEANSRKIREELRKRGEKISDHMKYSWEEDVVSKARIISMDQLYERMRRQSSETSSLSQGCDQSSPLKNWAKVNVALRDALRELQRVEFAETNMVERGSL